MEDQLLEIAFSNLLEELKEIRQEQQKTTATLLILNRKVDSFEQRLLNLKVTAPVVNITPVTTTIMQGLDNIKNTIEAQPKSITKQFRILLFPEYGAREYYGLVFGRLSMWIFFIFIAAYLFVLAKEYIEINATVRQAPVEKISVRKLKKNINKHNEKALKEKMDSTYMRPEHSEILKGV